MARKSERKGGTGLAVAAAAGVFLAFSHGSHHHGGLAFLDSFGSPPVHGGRQVVAFARHQLGCPYVWGGTGPCGSGFDCSGLAVEAWTSAGVTIPRTSQEQSAQLPHVSRSQLRPGDLVFAAGSDGTPSSPGHVVIYIGHGKVIQAYATGTPVEVSTLASVHAVSYADPGER